MRKGKGKDGKEIMVKKLSLIVDAKGHGQRLDVAMSPLVPHMGVRGRRRLWEYGSVTVNGKAKPCGFRVAQGDCIELVYEEPNMSMQAEGLVAIQETMGLAAVYKPSGLHSAHIAGSSTPSIEGLLQSGALDARLYGRGGERNGQDAKERFPQLLNRLDGPTSGMLLVALHEKGLKTWQEAEELGTIEKSYIAVACGHIEKARVIKAALNTDHRQVTEILPVETEDPLRHTSMKPLAQCTLGGHAVTIVQCQIHKGARHQIRAHMASLGHALLGDTMYGGLPMSAECGVSEFWTEPRPEPCPAPWPAFFLHHGRVVIGDFEASVLPSWGMLLPADMQVYLSLFR